MMTEQSIFTDRVHFSNHWMVQTLAHTPVPNCDVIGFVLCKSHNVCKGHAAIDTGVKQTECDIFLQV